MDCTKCSTKGCRTLQPCVDHREEIVEYAKIRNYQNLSVAYCYGLEKEAKFLQGYLSKAGFQTAMISCTVDGVPERDINPLKEDEAISCNPMGQANVLNSAEDFFLEHMDNSFLLINREQLAEKIQKDNWAENLALLDLRGREGFVKNGIPGSMQCLLNQLPDKYARILPDKSKEIVVYCNGGMQSLYAVMYLSLKGFTNVKSLAGGYSDGAWALHLKKEESLA